MGQGDGLASLCRSARSSRSQTLSRRIHRPHRVELSAAGGRQGAAAVSADFYRGGEIRAGAGASRRKPAFYIAQPVEKDAGAGQRRMKELLLVAQPKSDRES